MIIEDRIEDNKQCTFLTFKDEKEYAEFKESFYHISEAYNKEVNLLDIVKEMSDFVKVMEENKLINDDEEVVVMIKPEYNSLLLTLVWGFSCML